MEMFFDKVKYPFEEFKSITEIEWYEPEINKLLGKHEQLPVLTLNASDFNDSINIQPKIKETPNSHKTRKSNNKALKRIRNAECAKEFRRKKREKEEMKQRVIEFLQRENAALQKKNTSLQKKNEALQKKNEELKGEKKRRSIKC